VDGQAAVAAEMGRPAAPHPRPPPSLPFRGARRSEDVRPVDHNFSQSGPTSSSSNLKHGSLALALRSKWTMKYGQFLEETLTPEWRRVCASSACASARPPCESSNAPRLSDGLTALVYLPPTRLTSTTRHSRSSSRPSRASSHASPGRPTRPTTTVAPTATSARLQPTTRKRTTVGWKTTARPHSSTRTSRPSSV